MASITRKEFIRLLTAVCGTLALEPVLTACGTAVKTIRRPEIIKMFPTVPSRVVHAHHGGVWDGGALQPEALRQMLDYSVAQLTGLNDALAAWKALFAPDERIAIKVNTLQYGGKYWTHVPLVTAVIGRLQAAGVAAEQIVIYDKRSSDLEGGGFAINKDGAGVRCYGNDLEYETKWKIGNTDVGLSKIMLSCDALIDMPILKTHTMDGAGMSFALKNHYGTFDRPESFHGGRIPDGISGVNALAPVKDRTRLIIGDALKIVKNEWISAFDGDFITMSFDPVANDVMGLKVLNETQAANGIDPEPTRQLASKYLSKAADLGVGTNQMENIEFLEARLT
jgi:hypothetical protein